MKKRRKQIINPDDFSIYQSISTPDGCFAIFPDQIKIMDDLRSNYLNETIPDKYTIKVFKFGKVKDKDSDTEIWDITDQEPVEFKVSDLVSDKMGFIYCY